MGNLDFANAAGFSWYCILLLISGLTLVVLGPLRGQSRSGKVGSVVFGAIFFCYGLYLIFGFRGGHYFISYWALILPVVLITRAIRSSNGQAVRRRQESKETRYAELQDAQEAYAATMKRRSSAD